MRMYTDPPSNFRPKHRARHNHEAPVIIFVNCHSGNVFVFAALNNSNHFSNLRIVDKFTFDPIE